MTKEFFKETAFRNKSLVLIDKIDGIISSYARQGLRLTLRQAYYQCITQNMFPNTERSYKNLGNLISDGRLAGLLDWDGIEDRVRVPRSPGEYENLQEFCGIMERVYRLPRWAQQPEYVELWVEKDALAGVLSPIASKYHVTLMVNRGYSSTSAMHAASKRFIEAIDGRNQRATLLYLGDLDPSGEDMVRDVHDRLAMFGADVEVEKLALNMDQVNTHKPPPNPAKLSDSRAKAFVKKFGASSWEVDALPPMLLRTIISDAIESHLDMDLMEEVKKLENEHKKALREAVAQIN
jgi:hypothetical protein